MNTIRSSDIVIAGLLIGGAVVAAYLYTRSCSLREGLGGGGHGGGGGGHGGSGGGMGGHGGGGGGWHGGGHGWHGGGGRWRGRGWGYGGYGGGYGGWPWWWEWWNSPFYYIDDPRLQSVEDDPCDCFGKYKTAMDARVAKEEAKKILMSCVDKTLGGGPCA
jgi:hypothetical protein